MFFLLSVNSVFAQNDCSKWYFGNKAGLDFMSNPPTALSNGAMKTWGNCASIADINGNLLFYSEGDTVWNAQHQVMLNGTGLLGSSDATQGILILRKPGSGILYYIFTTGVSQTNSPLNGLRYSIVDMSLAAGMGSVTTKNVLLYDPSTLRIASVKHCNGTDVWIVSHDWNSTNFRSYLLSPSGLNPVPVLSPIGSFQTGPGWMAAHSMKISPLGNKLGITIGQSSSTNSLTCSVELYDFNSSTGIVSNSLTLLNNMYVFTGCEFSADGTKFYVAHSNQFLIYQWNLCAGSVPGILASQYSIAATSTAGPTQPRALQLAPDGRIYVAETGQQQLARINFPNLPGSACGYSAQAVSIAPKTSLYGLPNFGSNQIKVMAPVSYTQDLSCSTASFTPPAYANPSITSCFTGNYVSGLTWNFGDPGSGSANTSTLISPVHTYSAMGSYTIKLVLTYSSCAPDSIVQTIILVNPTVSINAATVSCISLTSATVNVSPFPGPFSYTWSPSAQSGSVANNLSPGVYTISLKNSSGNCVSTITTNVAAPLQITATSAITPTCTSVSVLLNVAGGSGNYSYTWTPGNYTTPVVSTLPSGAYTITIYDNTNQCAITHTLVGNTLPVPTISVSGNFTVCSGQSATLTASGADTYSWNTGITTPLVILSPTLTTAYSVIGTNTNSICFTLKTVNVVVSKCLGFYSENNLEPKIKVFPNPGNGKFTVECENIISEIRVVDNMGRLVKSSSARAKIIQLDLSEFPNEVYTIELHVGAVKKEIKLLKSE
ncbi:MAG: hypothetical protein PSX36_09590 [bacterium]|nr:hypothetical protein [bacterium]